MRIISFLFLLVLSIFTPFPVFLFVALVYIFVWTGYELLVIAVFLDTLFGITTTSFLYTLSIGVLLLCAEVFRPYLSWYTTRT
jgi:hypothetical protein